jgi:hypothetical protein
VWRLARRKEYAQAIASTQVQMARVLLLERKPDEAVALLQESLTLLRETDLVDEGGMIERETAVAWRVLGEAMASLPEEHPAVEVGGEVVTAVACFEKSLNILSGIDWESRLERVNTIHAWATYTQKFGDQAQGNALMQKGKTLKDELGICRVMVTI